MPDPLATFAGRLRDDPDTCAFSALDTLCQDVVGHKLFSCSHFEIDSAGRGTAARIYTSDENNYPTSGLKEIVPNRWTQIAIKQRMMFVANSIDEFSDVFPDHPLIASLGLGSVVNLPIILGGTFLGTVNLLHKSGYFGPDRLFAIGDIEAAAQLAFNLHRGRSISVNAA
jgi:hypothetical protein